MSKKFHPLDQTSVVYQSVRRLPHWYQPSAATFVTFRTFDSMPKQVVAQWHREMKLWLVDRGFEPEHLDELPDVNQLPSSMRNEYRRVYHSGWNRRLDECHGKCLLRRADLRQCVQDAIRYFDDDRYDLAGFVIMPNHVHLIVQMREGTQLQKQVSNWLRFTANKINQMCSLKGPFWRAEAFDHIIRTESQFWYLMDYMADNPSKANLAQHDATFVNLVKNELSTKE